jgi:hypothetical protein
LSNACVETLRILRLDAQRRDSAQISLRRALEILLHTFQAGGDYRPDDLRYNYLAGELQEVFLLAFGGDELALAVNNNLTSFSRLRNVAQIIIIIRGCLEKDFFEVAVHDPYFS